MRLLDYSLLQDLRDPVLRTLLIAVCQKSTVKRVQNAFPEFFTEEFVKSKSVALSDLAIRKQALDEDESLELEDIDILRSTLEWFGLPLYGFEYRTDGQEQRDYALLPADFQLERTEDYDGFTSDDPWLVQLQTKDQSKEGLHLVLAIQVSDFGDDPHKFFFWTTLAENISF